MFQCCIWLIIKMSSPPIGLDHCALQRSVSTRRTLTMACTGTSGRFSEWFSFRLALIGHPWWVSPFLCDLVHATNCGLNLDYPAVLLAYLLVRICSSQENLEIRFKQLRETLQSHGYRPKVVDAAIEKARTLDRKEALKEV